MVLAAALPMALVTVSDASETTFYIAQNHGDLTLVDAPATSFTLLDQFGHLATYLGRSQRYTLLAFLDPRCWTDCALLAGQLAHLSHNMSSSQRAHLQIVAVAANRFRYRISDLRHFLVKHDLTQVQNFHFVTGSLSALQKVWENYGIQVLQSPNAAMSVHSDVIYIISPTGRIRAIIPDNPAGTWAVENSSVAALLQALYAVGFR